VRNGESALFWKDSWQQLPPLSDLEILNPLKNRLQPNIFRTVNEFWIPTNRRQPWRQWKTSRTKLQIMEDIDLLPWQNCILHQKIPIKEGLNILRWGHSTTCIFSVSEAYYLQGNYQNQIPETIWSKVWQSIHWPKVSFFLWLTTQNRILTWDNILKKGFIGPSRGTLFQQSEETMKHLLNNCHYSQQIWDWRSQAMRCSQRNRGSIRDTLANWETISFQNPIL